METKEKYDQLLTILIQSIERRDGTPRIKNLQEKVKELVMEGMKRETICQLLSKTSLDFRFEFLIQYPGLIIPYFFRIKVLRKKDKQ